MKKEKGVPFYETPCNIIPLFRSVFLGTGNAKM